MNKKIAIAVIVISIVGLLPSIAFSDVTQSIRVLLQQRFAPDGIKVIAEHVKRHNNTIEIGKLGVDAKGSKINLLKVDRLVLEAKGIVLNDPENWFGKDGFKVLKVKELRFYAKIKRDDINSFISIVEKKSNNSHFSDARIRFKPPFLVLAVVYSYDLIFKIRIMLELKSRLSVKDSKVFLTDYTLFAGGLKVDKSTTENIIKKINPLIDLKKFPFPIRLKKIKVNVDSLELYTSPSPEI